MVVGFNHNVRYRGEVFHVQTEDGGRNNPHIITLLYRGGTILASKKSTYADITKADGLEQVVEELMKEQHRNMLRRLKAGDFDALITGKAPETLASAGKEPDVAGPMPEPATPAPPEKIPLAVASEAKPATSVPPPKMPSEVALLLKPEPPASSPAPSPPPAASLDEIILAYLVGDEGKGPDR